MDSSSFNIFCKPGMKQFLSCLKPGYKPPSRKKIAKNLKKSEQFNNSFFYLIIKRILINVNRYVSYINELKSGLNQIENIFEKSHNSENIGKFLSKQLVKLNIEDKIVSITTDNEAAVAKACSKLGNSSVRISCMCHNLNLVVKNGLKLWIKPKKSVLK